MIRYDLAAMAKEGGRPGRMRPTRLRLAGERALHREMRVMLRELRRETEASVLPRLAMDRRLRTDAADGGWFAGLGALVSRLTLTSEAMVRPILRLEGQRHTKGFMAAAKAAFGVDLAGVVREDDIAGAIEDRTASMVALIKGLTSETQAKIERIVAEASAQGTSMREVRRQLTDVMQTSDRRARLISRDQLGKYSANLDRIRQEQAGVTEYRWRTAQDERVRTRHARLEGKTYAYGKPTGAEDGLPPGIPVQCRCYAEPVIEF